MRIVLDLEANGLQPTEIHCVVCKDIDKGHVEVFRKGDWDALREYLLLVTTYVGHNIIGYDAPALDKILGITVPLRACVDTLVLSRLLDEGRKDGHSLEAWGKELGKEKVGADIEDWSVWTQEMEDRCVADTEINFLLFKRFEKYLNSDRWKAAIETEHFIAFHCENTLHKNGFAFDLDEAVKLLETIEGELQGLTEELQKAFPPRSKLVKVITPTVTKHGTLHRGQLKWAGEDLSQFREGQTFSRIKFIEFNPGSPPQVVQRLNEAGWKPYEKTDGHKEAQKELATLQRKRKKTSFDFQRIEELSQRLDAFRETGWSINEANLKTLPDTAPPSAQTLARVLLLRGRVNILRTWIAACDPQERRIHGSFTHIGAWTHRMSHSNPNQGNIPKFDARQPHKTPYSDKMRALWSSSPGRFLVGVDAESIQLRVFAHYIDDKEFTESLVSGKKELGTDPHSVNLRALSPVCKSRDDAKTFIYAFVLDVGDEKAGQIFNATKAEGREAKEKFILRYPGLKYIKEEIVPFDAARGYFEGFDGRLVRIFGEDEDARKHFTMAGYLQNGESVIMKRAVQIWLPKLERARIPFWWVNFVHDEWQTETMEDIEIAKFVAQTQADAIREVGEDLRLRCPFAGSVLSDHGTLIDGLRWAIGKNWMVTH